MAARVVFLGGFKSDTMKRPVFVALLLIVGCALGHAQVPPKNIKDLAFMAGKWTTHSAWGDMEENWSEPMGDCMMCAYRCVKDGKVIFYEFIVIEQTDTGPVMKLRHFSPGNIGWEDKDKPYEYPLMFLEPDKARFERPDKKTALTFHRTSPETMQVILERQDKSGRWVEDIFDYKLSR
jgi:hypothetical protein